MLERDERTGADEGGRDEGMDQRIARREAIKKAAAGTAVAGAVWAAPRVEGLSLVPDYAEAGTNSTAPITFVINSTDEFDTNNYYGNNDRNSMSDLTGCGFGPNDFITAVPGQNPGITITPFPNSTQTHTITMTAPLGPAGSTTVTIPQGLDGDLEKNETVNVTFNIDPPWNKCRINAVTFNKCAPGSAAGSFSLNNNPAPDATNPAPFVSSIVVPSQPMNWSEMRITVQCS